ncbi:zeta toxin-domain-containing protein [Lasiosphaeria ovina]|uniref:Zeta toxin-domain-containing protein n=1 Tax=Lasiosphaeria ovina TaxID=92902 RepID=A0AAE0TUJ1_9PEZI|nr:zeta toxin-domain-containing protein [Lasiosphaeria ovina]
MAGLPEAWKLQPQDRLAIFDKEIAPHELQPYLHLHHRDDGKRPVAVLIVGQTGAGKTRLAPDLTKAMVDGNRTPAHFIADTYKTYHPHYAECLEKAPEKASVLAGLDARIWLTMACEYAADQRLDVLAESACRHPDDFCDLAELFHKRDYNVRVAILAVPEALSRLGILVRYYRNLPEAQSRNLPLRLTPKKVHDDSYAGLALAASFIDQNPVADAVIVVRRNNMLAYKNERAATTASGGTRAWQADAGASRSLEIERTRPLSLEEKRTAESDIEELKKLHDPKVDVQIREIEGYLASLAAGSDSGQPLLPPLEPLDAAKKYQKR